MGVEANRRRVDDQLREEGVRGGQGRMAAERNLERRGEPAKAEARRLVGAQQERGFSLVIFGGERLHPGIIWPFVERLDDARRIAPERRVGEGVDGPLAHGATYPVQPVLSAAA